MKIVWKNKDGEDVSIGFYWSYRYFWGFHYDVFSMASIYILTTSFGFGWFSFFIETEGEHVD